MSGVGAEYLNALLKTVAHQEGVDFKAIVSDQSTDSKVEEVCKLYDFVEYHRFDGPRNPCDNLNHCISKSDAKVVKIMFQDDLFCSPKDSLLKCVKPILNGECKWTASACLHSRDGVHLSNPMTPRYHDSIHLGNNTVSSPSVIAFLNDGAPQFDNRLQMLLDVDWYKRMRSEFGDLGVVKDYCVVNRVHDKSLGSMILRDNSDSIKKELALVREKHKIEERMYILFPPNAEAGGVESIFQGCDSINRNGGDCWLVYEGEHLKDPIPEKYKCYENVKTSHISNVDMNKKNLMILPEVFTDKIPDFSDMGVAIWWLSVDNNHGKFRDFANDDILHLYQSEYAKDFLVRNGANNILPFHDYINEFEIVESERQNLVCFNPAKGLEKTRFIANNTPEGVGFVPLSGMSKQDMIRAMSACKIYIDFGHHPGRDRIPREAALLGCLVITSRDGSAGFHEDIPVDERYKIGDLNPSIGALLNDLIQNYDSEVSNFDHYREVISGQKSAQDADSIGLISHVREMGKNVLAASI